MRIGRSALGVLSSNLLNLLLAVANSIFLTRTLGVTGRGEYAVFIASVGILSLLLGLGVDTAIRYFVAKERVARERILSSLILFVLAAGTVAFGVARLNHLLLDNELLLPRRMQRPAFELTLIGVVVANLFHANVSSVFAGRRRFAALNLASVGFSVASLVVWFGFFSAERAGVASFGSDEVFPAYLALTVANAVVLAGLAYRYLGVRPSWKLLDWELFRDMIRYAAKAFAAQVAQFLNYRVDIWIVQVFLGAAALGLYSLAASLATMLWILPRSASRVLMPYVAAEEEGAPVAEVARISRLFFLATAAIAVVAALTVEHWIGLLYGAEFVGAGPAFVVLLVGSVPFSLSVVLAATLSGMNRLEENLVASFAGLVVTVVLDLILIPRYGIAGAAWASSASYLVTTVVVVRAFSKVGDVSVRDLILPRREDLAYVTDGLKSLLR